MKTYIKNGLPNFSSPSSSNSDPVSPTLQDSKSTSNLCHSPQQIKKFRQTTYFPNTTKNSNRQYLRFTVNLNKSDQQSITSNMIPVSSIRIQRKLTIQDHQKKFVNDPESPSLIGKPNSAQKNIQKKNSNPQKKQDQTLKQSPIPKFLQKKNISADTPTDNSHKTERIQAAINNIANNTQKKFFTPKSIKAVDEQNSANKIIASFSSSDLMKNNQSSSPTCQSLNSPRHQRETNFFFLMPKIQHFNKLKYLGQGKFGQVHLVSHIETGTLYAMKQIKKSQIARNKMQEQLLMEIKMQFYLNHPNILKLYGIMHDQQYIYLILEYMEEGTLYSVLRRKKTLKQADASRKLRDVLDGVNYLHGQMIAHRDLKPENIVISHDVCKICDLGWAALCDERRKTLCGTIDYASPELLEGKQYGIAIDLWCLGVLCYELMVGKCPFYHISRKQTMKKIINADISDLNLLPSIPCQTRDFIGKLLLKNPQQRMSAQNALQHQLITKYFDQDLEQIRNIQRKKP